MSKCKCGNDGWWIFDGYGIDLCVVCDVCEGAAVASYRPDIFTSYEADEPIEPDGWD